MMAQNGATGGGSNAQPPATSAGPSSAASNSPVDTTPATTSGSWYIHQEVIRRLHRVLRVLWRRQSLKAFQVAICLHVCSSCQWIVPKLDLDQAFGWIQPSCLPLQCFSHNLEMAYCQHLGLAMPLYQP